ncbi:MAG TPA: Dyp-type peroxidase [Chloroflexota bacterium]
MLTPQSGIFALGTASVSYLEFDIHPDCDPRTVIRLVADLRGPRGTTGGVNLVIGFRPELWRAVAPDDIPAGVSDFAEDLVGPDGYRMPATQHDLYISAAGHSYDPVFDTAREAIAQLEGVATLKHEIKGWTYRDSRDLTGFIDGTANPSLAMAPAWVLIPDGQPGAVGTVLLVQKWVHHARAWEALPVSQQERIIGRTKLESVELPEAVTGPTSHVARTTVEENGAEVKVFRRNTPFGQVEEHGTMFVGYSKDQSLLHRMLERMAGIPDGIRDALTQYTDPLTGAYYFVPAIEAIEIYGSGQNESG